MCFAMARRPSTYTECKEPIDWFTYQGAFCMCQDSIIMLLFECVGFGVSHPGMLKADAMVQVLRMLCDCTAFSLKVSNIVPMLAKPLGKVHFADIAGGTFSTGDFVDDAGC